MKTQYEIAKIEESQDRQYKIRKTVFKILSKSGLDVLASKSINGDRLKKSEINLVFSAARDVGHPVPENKTKVVFWALINSLEFRHFNQFGQELK